MKEVRICPKCGSINIKRNYHHGLSFIAGTPVTFSCKKCKFTSEMFPIINIKDIEKIQNKLKK